MFKDFKCIFIFLILCVVTLYSNKAYAFNLKEQSTGYYFTFTSDTGKNFSDEFKIYYIDGRTSYCIEPGTTIGSTGYTQSNLDDLDSFIKDNILDYMYYGYSFNNKWDVEYYIATQALIWEQLLSNNQEVVISSQLFKKGTIFDFTSYKERIIKDINTYKNQFHNQNYKVLLGSTLSINEFELNYNYDITSNDFSIDVNNNTNVITISNLNNRGRYNINITEKNRYLDNYIVYKSSSKQDLLVLGNIEHPKYNISLTIEGGELNIYKHNQLGNPLEGALFGVYSIDGKLICEAETDKDGVVYIYNLFPKGRYYIKELKAPDGYLLNEDVSYFDIDDDNKVVNMYFINNMIVGKLKINKLDKDSNEPISDTIFTIYDDKLNVLYELTTNEDGIIDIDLEYGTYYYQETLANELYELDNTMYELSILDNSIHEVKINNNKKVIPAIEQEDNLDLLVIDNVPNTNLSYNYYLLIILGVLIVKRFL